MPLFHGGKRLSESCCLSTKVYDRSFALTNQPLSPFPYTMSQWNPPSTGGDDWDSQAAVSVPQPREVFAKLTCFVHQPRPAASNDPVPDDWEADDNDTYSRGATTDSQRKLWEDAYVSAPHRLPCRSFRVVSGNAHLTPRSSPLTTGTPELLLLRSY